MAQNVGVLGTGSYAPARVVSNAEVAGPAGVTSDWITVRTQIRSRRYAAPEEATSDLAVRAAAQALANAGLAANEVDFLVLATSTPDHPQPPTSYLVQHALGASGAVCLDINVVCSGFVYGLEVARGLLAMRPGGHALVVGADIYSRIVDPADRASVVLFGDGAGAVVVGPCPEAVGIIGTELRSNGSEHDLVGVHAGGSRAPASVGTLDAGLHYFRMRGRDVRRFVTDHVPPILSDLLRMHGTMTSEIDHFVPHQANGVMLDDLAKTVGLAGAQIHRTVEQYGNTGSASIPLTLDQANRDGRFRRGDLVLLAGFGGGMSLGACLLRWCAGQ
ncbi:3-oxoacyl-ACP synthase III family protein [Plantactinospora sp. WMMC1484]|uniref:3-oxoacyl-ACP synthase III family protein n=1 Tax=Plantactinospora sp. WMMC1484 TaxID=3404122 RepID=UPI003BF56FAB